MKVENETRTNILTQLALLMGSPQWAATPPPNTMRGVDFYTMPNLVQALANSAQLFKNSHGYMPFLAAPTTFNEHIFARKFLAPLAIPSVADKLYARDYVRARAGDDVLTTVPWSGNIDDLFTAALPAGRFFLKLNTGCHHNLLLNLPEDLTLRRNEITGIVHQWYQAQYGLKWGEWHYSTIEPKLLLEQFIDFNGDEVPDDYKFYCFEGKVHLISVNSGRFRSLYYPSWQRVNVSYAGSEGRDVSRPENLDALIWVAEKISSDMDFARIDLYTNTKDAIKFGEITLTPGNANKRYSRFQFDRYLGQFFKTDVA